MLLVVMDEGEQGDGLELRHSEDGLRIEMEGTVTVTDPDGRQHTECARQKWSFSADSGFLLTIHFGTELKPRIAYAGTAKTPADHIGEAIASAIRATSTPSETPRTPE